MKFIDGLKEWAQDPSHKVLKGLAGFAIFGTVWFLTGSLWVSFAVWIGWKCLIS